MSQESTRKQSHILMASVTSSIISTMVSNPVEVAKLNIQYFPLACPQYPHESYAQLIKCSCSKFSIAGNFKSLKIAVPQVVIVNMVYMQLYEKQREYFINKLNFSSINSTLLASFISRFVVTTLNIPIQTLRIQLSNETATKKLFDNFHGYRVTLTRDMIYSALFWTMLQSYRNKVSRGQYRRDVQKRSFDWKNFSINLLPGFVFGGIVSAITTPLDTLKTRVQSQGIKEYSIIKDIYQIYKKENINGLFSGVRYRVLKNSLHTSIYLFCYEWLLSNIQSKDIDIGQIDE